MSVVPVSTRIRTRGTIPVNRLQSHAKRTVSKSLGTASRYAVEVLEKRFLLAAGSVVINEINYNPADKTAHTEFVELTNPGTTAVDLSGASFTNGIHYTFASGTSLPAGGFIVVAENPTAIQNTYHVSSYGPYTGSLSNSGEDVTIVDASGNTLDDVDYGVGFPWPLLGDSPGPNYSLELINPTYDNSLGGNWRSYDPTVPTSVTIIPKGSSWDYLKGTAEATPSPYAIGAWRTLDFDENGWSSGSAPIGYDAAGGPAMGTTLSDMSGNYTSVFMRKIFNIPDPAEALGLTLSAMYDDGFNVWINGHLAQTVNTPGENTAFNGLASSARAGSDATYHDFTISPTYLQAGDNVIAIQYFNAAKTDPDAYFDASLTEKTGTGGPTPGRQNSVYTTATPPVMRQLTLSTQEPQPNTPETISMKVTDAAGVGSVLLSYETVDAGSYVSVQDDAYANAANWTSVAMHDDGLNGDAVSGDGIYSVTLPASVQVNRRLVRFRVTATGNDGASITGPYKDDPVPNFAYYVYAGTPSYTAALQPGVTTATTYSAATMGSIPYLTLLTTQQSHDNAQGIPGSNAPQATSNEYGYTGTLVYNGVVYDDIHYRSRGGVWRYAMGKNMWKIDFQNGHDFQAYYTDGTPYPTTWKKLDLGADIQQGDIGDRGEDGLFETMSFGLFNLAGVPAPGTIPTTLRIVQNASETGSDQYSGDFQGLYLMVEEPDGHFLDAHGLPDGNYYKIEGGSGTEKNQGPTEVTDGSDLTAFVSALNNNPSEAWIQANIDLPEFYSFQATVEMVHHWDIGFGKNYYYYHNPDTNKWDIMPWDTDLTWYVNYEPSGGDLTPFANAILKYPDLAIQYKDRVRELRDTLFNSEMIGKLADAYANEVDPGGATSGTLVQADAAMWDYNPIESSSYVQSSKATVGRYWLNGSPTQNFPGMVAELKTWAIGRFAYLDNTVIGSADTLAAPAKPTVTYTGTAGFPVNGLSFASSAFVAGNTNGAFAGMEWRLADVTNGPGINASTEASAVWDSGVLTTYNSSITIPSNVGLIPGHVYRLRVKMEDANGRWSDWSDVNAGSTQFVASASSNVKNSLRITELQYDPSKVSVGGGGSQYNNDDFEFVELENFGATAISLLGVQFTDGITYTFGNVALAPGQVGVLVHNTAAFQSRYGTSANIIGDYLSTGQSFSNSGEHVELVDAFGQTLDDFTYSSSWYASTHGSGPSLEVINPQVSPDLNNPANWRASSDSNGTPGVGSTSSLPAPSAATGTPTTTQVSLSWTDNATTETGYSIFRSAAGGAYTQLTTLPANATSFVDTTVSAGIAYNYLIQATGSGGTFSDAAAVAVNTPPIAPTNLVGTPGSGSATLNWSVPVGAVTYNVYRGSTTGGEGLTPLATNVALPSYTDTTVTTGSNYYYVVTAVNSSGVESARSSEVSILLGASDFYSFDEASGNTVTDSIGTNTGTLIGATKPTRVAGKVGSGALSFSGDGVNNSTTSQSAVQTANDLSPILGATSSLAFWIKTTQVGNNTHWLAPAITGVEVAGGSNDIGWGYIDGSGHISMAVGDSTLSSTAVINNGTWHQITLTRDSASGVVQIYVDGALNASGNLGSGNRTTAFNKIGERADVQGDGVTSNGATYFNGSLDSLYIYNRVVSAGEVTALAAVTAAPTNVVATPSSSSVSVSWSAVAGASSYTVYRGTATGQTNTVVAASFNGTLFNDTGLTNGTTYYYTVVANDAAGASVKSSEVSAVPASQAVSNLTVSVTGGRSLHVSWSGTASNINGLYIERSVNQGTYVQIGTLSAFATSFDDSGLTPGALYSYRIRSYTGSTTSAYVTSAIVRTAIPGDVNGSGKVDSTDFAILQANFGQSGGWAQGDLDGNGVINFADFMILQNCFGNVAPALPSALPVDPTPTAPTTPTLPPTRAPIRPTPAAPVVATAAPTVTTPTVTTPIVTTPIVTAPVVATPVIVATPVAPVVTTPVAVPVSVPVAPAPVAPIVVATRPTVTVARAAPMTAIVATPAVARATPAVKTVKRTARTTRFSAVPIHPTLTPEPIAADLSAEPKRQSVWVDRAAAVLN